MMETQCINDLLGSKGATSHARLTAYTTTSVLPTTLSGVEVTFSFSFLFSSFSFPFSFPFSFSSPSPWGFPSSLVSSSSSGVQDLFLLKNPHCVGRRRKHETDVYNDIIMTSLTKYRITISAMISKMATTIGTTMAHHGTGSDGVNMLGFVIERVSYKREGKERVNGERRGSMGKG